MKTAIIVLSILATATQAHDSIFNINPINYIKSLLGMSDSAKSGNVQGWPYVEWPGDSEQPGVLYTWNETTKELSTLANTTFTTYLDVSHNRQKIVSHTVIPDSGFTEIIQYFDYNNHFAYQKIAKFEQCKIVSLPQGFNLTEVIHDSVTESAGKTFYQGVVSLPWVHEKDETFHKFHVTGEYWNSTAYFCTKCLQIKWQVPDKEPHLVINFPNGVNDRVFTDADFDGLTCESKEPILPFNPNKNGGIFA
eukprot:403337832